MQPSDEVVDVREVIKDLARAQNNESPACDTAKQLQQTPIAGSVDARRPRDDNFHSRLARGRASDVLAFELRLLVDVARTERRIFVCWRPLDVAMHADGAAVHN